MLDSLANKFDVAFSYADENIAEIKVPMPESDLATCLEFLSERTGLKFDQLDKRYIAITKKAEKFTFCGYLKDRVTDDPIAFAVIKSEESDQYSTTDTQGYFQISSTESIQQISISHISYQSLKIEMAASQKCYDIFLKPGISQLEEVYVSNYLTQGIDRQINGQLVVRPGNFQVVSGLSEPDVLNIMQVFPGIQSPEESVSNINIRGGTNDQNLILWDGIRMYQSSHFFGLITAFNPYFTEKVTLTKNGSSASLGNGVSGIIDINSGDQVHKDFKGGGGINLLSADVNAHIPLSKKASLSLAGRRSTADLFQTPTYNNYFERAFEDTEVTASYSSDSVLQTDEDFNFYDISGKLNYDISDKDHLNISFINLYNKLEYQQERIVDGSGETKTSSLTQKSLAGSVRFRRKWSRNLSTHFGSYVSTYKLGAINFNVLDNQRLIQENDVLELGVKLDSRLFLNSNWELLNGLEYTETGVVSFEDLNNPDFRRRNKDVLRSQVAFTEVNYYSPSEKTHLQFGLRANYYHQLSKFIMEPRLVAGYKLFPFLSLELLGEFKNQPITQVIDLQNDFLGVEKRRWILSDDENIPVIQSKQASVGFHYNQNNFLISAEGYYKYVDGIITSSQAFQNQFEFLRTSGSYRIYGTDFLLRKKFEHLSSWVSYAWSHNNYRFSQLSVNEFPNNLDVRHHLTVGSTYQNEHFQFSTSINWHSGRPYTMIDLEDPVVDQNLNYESPNGHRQKEYFRVDLSGKYLFPIGEDINGQIGFSIWNLTNYINVLRSYYQLQDEGTYTRIDEHGLRFTPNSVMRINF